MESIIKTKKTYQVPTTWKCKVNNLRLILNLLMIPNLKRKRSNKKDRNYIHYVLLTVPHVVGYQGNSNFTSYHFTSKGLGIFLASTSISIFSNRF